MSAPKGRLTRVVGDYKRTFDVEDGKFYRGHHQDMAPIMDRVNKIKDAQQLTNKQNNPTDRRYIGSVPFTFITDWLKKNNYTIDQFARNEDNCKDKFKRYFLSRDFNKFHTQSVLTKRESSVFSVPKNFASKAIDLTGIKNGTTELRRTKE